MVRRFALLAMLAIAASALGTPARADAAAEIRAVIQDQLDAFAVGDAPRAFSHASPDIQARFGSSAVFMTMVEAGYAALIRPREFEIEDVRADGDVAAARARLISADGRVYQAIYPLRRLPDGAWRIDGCQLEQAPGRSL